MKKLISIVVVMAMLMSLSAVALANGTTTVYCNAPSSWSNCNVYWWGSKQVNPGWPGEAMTKGADGIWYYEVPSDATNVIFNNGSVQSADLTMPTDNKVQFNYTDKEWVTYGTAGGELTLVTVYVDIEGAGLASNVNAYLWDCVSANSWPGTAMTHVEGNIYSIEVYSDAVNIIFNDGSNQTADLQIPTDGKNLWNGTEWTTYPPAAPEAPTYNLVAGVTQSISIPVGGYVNVVVDATASDMVLSVNGNRTYFDWYVQAGMMPSYPMPNGIAEAQLMAGGSYTIPIYNTSEDAVQVVDVTADAPATGTMENPSALVIGTNIAEVEAGSWGYFFTWTAAEDGKLTIAIDTSVSSDWTFCINVYGDSTSYGDMHFSDDSPVDSDETVSVKAGDRVEIVVSSASFGDATVVLNASFEAGGNEGGEDDVAGSSKDNAINITNNPWHYIEAGATVWFFYDDSFDALFNGIYSQLLSLHGTDYEVEYNGQKLPVDADGYVNVELSSLDGKYYLAITNTGAEKAFFSINLEDKPAYVNTGDYVYVGENQITLDPSAEYTLWEFEPSQTGVYVLSIPNALGLIGNWGSSWYPQDQTENKSNTLEWTCTSVGQSIMVGVAGVDSTVLTIERTGDYVAPDEMEWEIYENEQLKSDYIVDGDLTAIDVTDDIPDTVFIDENGFFRYGSENGPIIVADLSDCPVNFVEASINGQLRFYVYQDGVLIAKIDVNNAMVEYVDAGITPMTEELAFMLKMLGEKNGWYDPTIMGFYLWSGVDGEETIIVNPEEAWLFPCYIVEGTEIDPGENPGDDNTGDNDSNPEVILSDYIVAGSSGLCGVEWDPANAANKMIDNGDGTYSITFKNVAVGTYEFKIAKGSWAENWGVGGLNGGNVTVNVETVGDVTITFVAATGEITVNNEPIPSTGDTGMNAVLIAVVLTAMCAVAVVCSKKKFF